MAENKPGGIKPFKYLESVAHETKGSSVLRLAPLRRRSPRNPTVANSSVCGIPSPSPLCSLTLGAAGVSLRADIKRRLEFLGILPKSHGAVIPSLMLAEENRAALPPSVPSPEGNGICGAVSQDIF